jgi:superfamily I DNA and/or RNA helicase
MNEENIFGRQAIQVGIRIPNKSEARFDQAHPEGPSFSRILNHLESQGEVDAFFTRWSKKEHQIIVPIAELDGQIELVVRWLDRLFNYELRVNHRKETRFEQQVRLPDEKDTFLTQTCRFKFFTSSESLFPDQNLLILKGEVDKLTLPSRVNVEKQAELWEKFIEAESLILKSLEKPFSVKKLHQPTPLPMGNGYELKVDLFYTRHPEYLEIEKELESLDIFERFDAEGNIYLPLEDIFRGLDLVIERKFKLVIQRESVGAIIKISPIDLSYFLKKEFERVGYPGKVFFYPETNSVAIEHPTGLRKLKRLVKGMSRFGLKMTQLSADFEIVDLPESIEKWLQKKFPNLKLGNEKRKGKGKKELNRKLQSPETDTQVFRFKSNPKKKNLEEKLDQALRFESSLTFLFGPQRVRLQKVQVNFKDKDNETSQNQGFEEDFWKDIKRDFYLWDEQIETNPGSNTLYFEFSTREEFEGILGKLQSLGKFQLNYQPENYKFKVKTAIIAHKTQEQLFQEKLQRLAGAEVGQWEWDSEGRYFRLLGKLMARPSSVHQLILRYHSNSKSEDKKIEDNIIWLLENGMTIRQVEPNLRGEQAKIDWLKKAIKKISKPGGKAHERPQNENLGQFIFDSSKARKTHKDLRPGSDAWEDVSQHKILPLNESQQQAVVRAIYAQDLCLLQGPPGTGKTTVIAEMIWHMIRLKPENKVLLTSETNLAVDNALERLQKAKKTLVKPLRFGRSSKMEEEGKMFDWVRIKKWAGLDAQEEEYETTLEDFDQDAEEEAPKEKTEKLENNAVANWMNAIAERAYGPGRDARFDQVLKDWSTNLVHAPDHMRQEFATKYREYANVVGSTCTSTGSKRFASQFQEVFNQTDAYLEDSGRWNWDPVKFDVVIMDEASKATPPEMVMPLCLGEKNIIIGDHRQLPPMLHEKSLKEVLTEYGGKKGEQLAREIDKEFVETSQFERLIMNGSADESIKATFNVQYRMHPHINDVIRQFYLDEGGLDCGLDLSKVDSPDMAEPQSRYHGLYLKGFISPDVHTIWVDVDEAEEQEGTSRQNLAEVDAVRRVLDCLHRAKGFEAYQKSFVQNFKHEHQRTQEQEIGVISFYGSQVKRLKEQAKTHAETKLKMKVRLNTVDKFQGMERNIIIVSTVRSDKIKRPGDVIEKNHDIGFARSPKRLNVALSRARRLLIVVGNKRFFGKFHVQGKPIYQHVIDEIAYSGKIISYEELKKLSD